MVKYYYDAWGKCKAFDADGNEIPETEDHIANHNPFRYRGYYYEKGAKLYYLKSRFYDPETGRFVSPDDISYLAPDMVNGLNLYAYCGNNPVMRVDPNGNFAISAILSVALKGLIGAGINTATSFVAAKATGQDFTWKDAVSSAISGAVGAFSSPLGAAINAIYSIEKAYKDGYSMETSLLIGGITAISSMITMEGIIGVLGGDVSDALTNGVVNLVFGASSSLLTEAISETIMMNSTNNSQSTDNTNNSKIF